jgi:regulatory protein
MTEQVTIEAIEVAGPDRRARRLVFSDCGMTRTTSAAVVKALGLEPGASYPVLDLETDLQSEEETVARERALRLLAYRERSPEELRVRLARDGYPCDLITRIVDRFVEIELVDESRFARMWASSRAAAGMGTSRIRRELSERGVSDAVAEEAVAHLADGEVERAISHLRGRIATTRQERDRLTRRLIVRGFSYGVAREAIEAVAADREDDGPLITE